MDIGDLRRLVGGVQDQNTKRILTDLVETMFGRGGVQWGAVDHQQRAKNFTGFYLEGTTSTTADAEFSIAHGLGAKPYVALQVLPLDSTGGQIVRLRTTRIADSQRVYLASPDTGKPITIYVE